MWGIRWRKGAAADGTLRSGRAVRPPQPGRPHNRAAARRPDNRAAAQRPDHLPAARRPDHLPPAPIPGTGITPITRPPDGGPEPAVYGLPPWADDVNDR
jgi:hypothetical protein